MYLEVGIKCSPVMLFSVPHKAEPIKFKTLAKEFPEFVAMFDGKSFENTMSFYWKRNKQTGVYEFLDADSEDEVAELMGVELCEENEEEDAEEVEQRQLTEDEVTNFKDELSFIREKLRLSGFAKGGDTQEPSSKN